MERTDRQALADLYARYGTVVYRRARQLLGNEPAARDACHEVFLRAWQDRPDLNVPSPVSWLYRITTNHCLNVLRDDRRRRQLLEENVTAAAPSAPAVPLAVFLHGVPPALREIAVYYYVDGLSQDEIAELLGIPQRTISKRIAEFRRLIEEAWDESPARTT